MDYKKRALRRKSYADVKAMHDIAKLTKISLAHQLKENSAQILKDNHDYCIKVENILLKELMNRMVKIFPKDF